VTPILDKINDANVVCFQIVGNTIVANEACDFYYEVVLTPSEVRQLAHELTILAAVAEGNK